MCKVKGKRTTPPAKERFPTMKPITVKNGYGLWYSRHDGGFYWQDGSGAGDWTSSVYKTEQAALYALKTGMVMIEHRKHVASSPPTQSGEFDLQEADLREEAALGR